MQQQRLNMYLDKRPSELKEAKNNGLKVVGYFPGNYVPEEIIHAAGAIPVCLVNGGNSRPADAALSVVPNVICPFARTQIGEKLSNTNPYYGLIDMFIAPITCQHLKKVAEIWEYYDEIEIFKLGIPHQYNGDFELEYYIERLEVLRERLQALTGNKITDQKINEAIELYNRMRKLFRDISLMRRSSSSPLGTLDFVKLHHASFYADPTYMVKELESIYRELGNGQPVLEKDSPRLLIIGPNIACGDYKLLEMVQEIGGNIVVEEICEGIRYYWSTINNNGHPLKSLAQGYLRDRVPCAFMTDSTKSRFDFTLKLIGDFNVSGVIWYELLSCETYDTESYYFSQKLSERNMPMITIESDYGMSDTGQLRTRIQAFIEVVKGGLK